MSQIRIIIADDMAPIRDYLSMVLSRESDMKVIDTVGSGTEAVSRVLATRPDVLLMDPEIGTPQAGIDAIKTITTLVPGTRLIVLALFSDDYNILSALEAGASDYVLKNYSTGEILEAVRMVTNDVFLLRQQIARLICAELQILRSERNVLIATLNIIFCLSPKELGILKLIINGKNENEIAELQNVEFFIIQTHIRNILRKFGESSVSDIVDRLYGLGISEMFIKKESVKLNEQKGSA